MSLLLDIIWQSLQACICRFGTVCKVSAEAWKIHMCLVRAFRFLSEELAGTATLSADLLNQPRVDAHLHPPCRSVRQHSMMHCLCRAFHKPSWHGRRRTLSLRPTRRRKLSAPMVEEMEGPEGAGPHQTEAEAGHRLVCHNHRACEATSHACLVLHTLFLLTAQSIIPPPPPSKSMKEEDWLHWV